MVFNPIFFENANNENSLNFFAKPQKIEQTSLMFSNILQVYTSGFSKNIQMDNSEKISGEATDKSFDEIFANLLNINNENMFAGNSLSAIISQKDFSDFLNKLSEYLKTDINKLLQESKDAGKIIVLSDSKNFVMAKFSDTKEGIKLDIFSSKKDNPKIEALLNDYIKEITAGTKGLQKTFEVFTKNENKVKIFELITKETGNSNDWENLSGEKRKINVKRAVEEDIVKSELNKPGKTKIGENEETLNEIKENVDKIISLGSALVLTINNRNGKSDGIENNKVDSLKKLQKLLPEFLSNIKGIKKTIEKINVANNHKDAKTQNILFDKETFSLLSELRKALKETADNKNISVAVKKGEEELGKIKNELFRLKDKIENTIITTEKIGKKSKIIEETTDNKNISGAVKKGKEELGKIKNELSRLKDKTENTIITTEKIGKKSKIIEETTDNKNISIAVKNEIKLDKTNEIYKIKDDLDNKLSDTEKTIRDIEKVVEKLSHSLKDDKISNEYDVMIKEIEKDFSKLKKEVGIVKIKFGKSILSKIPSSEIKNFTDSFKNNETIPNTKNFKQTELNNTSLTKIVNKISTIINRIESITTKNKPKTKQAKISFTKETKKIVGELKSLETEFTKITKSQNKSDNKKNFTENRRFELSNNKTEIEEGKIIKDAIKTPAVKHIEHFEKNIPQNLTKTITVNKDEIIKRLANFIQKGDRKSIEIQIKPEHLGKLKLALDLINDTVKASIKVETIHAKTLIENNLNELYSQLNKSGVQLTNVSITLNQNWQKQERQTNFDMKKAKRNGKIKNIDEEMEMTDIERQRERNFGYNTYEYLM